MGKKSGGSSSTTTTYKPSPEESALMQQALKFQQAIYPNAIKLNDVAGNLLYNSLGDTQVDYTQLMNNALSQIQAGQTGISNLANGVIPESYQTAMENSIKSGVENSMGNLLSDLGARGVVNSSVMDTGLKGISDSAANTMAQNWNNTVSQLSGLYGQQIDAAGQPIANASAAQEAAQQPALNLWNSSLGLGTASNGALSAIGGKGTSTSSQKNPSSGGLFGGILSGIGGIFCFAPETKVRKADGKEVPITEIQAGDTVLCPQADGTDKEEQVLCTATPTYNDCWNIICKDNDSTHIVSATLTQPIMTADGQFVEIGKLTLGSEIKGRGKIINMVYSGERKVYDLQVSGENNYYADGFIAKGGSTDNWVKDGENVG